MMTALVMMAPQVVPMPLWIYALATLVVVLVTARRQWRRP